MADATSHVYNDGNLPSDPDDDLREPTQRDYAETVWSYAWPSQAGSDHPGVTYRPLAQLLMNPYRAAVQAQSSPSQKQFPFLIVHNLQLPVGKTATAFDSGTPGREQFCKSPPNNSPGSHVMFLRGYPSSDWLNLLGCRYRIDPQYYRPHLEFGLQQNHFDLPSLPSVSRNNVQLPMTTLGLYAEAHAITQEDVERQREDAPEAIKRHLRGLGEKGRIGESIVRGYRVHDGLHFSIEQRISICVMKKQGSWTAIVWRDDGRELKDSPEGPWLRDPKSSTALENRLLPVIPTYPKIALKNHNQSRRKIDVHAPTLAGRVSWQESPSFLNPYGPSLDHETLKVDAMYALSNVFALSAFSEGQFLNFMDIQICKSDQTLRIHTRNSLSNLKHIKSILEVHAQSLRESVSWLNNLGASKWPRATLEPCKTIAATAAHDVTEDFKALLERANILSRRCSDGIATIVSEAQLLESRKAIEQAGVVARLTFLAFLFIPLSFTTSFFGMNVQQLTQASLSIYWWFVMTVPVLVVSLLVCFWNVVSRKLRTRKTK